MRFSEGNTVRPRAEAPQPGRVNYFFGTNARRRLTDIPTFERLRYEDVWKGIDVLFYGADRQLEYDVVVAPGATVGSARMVFEGADTLSVTPSGELIVTVGSRQVRYSRPVAYQIVGGKRIGVAAGYVRLAATAIGFRAGPYDARLPLVIDPVLIFSILTPGPAVAGVHVDSAGNIYAADHRRDAGNRPDACVTKLSRDGSALVYRTCIGGAGVDRANSVAVDSNGGAYVFGFTDNDGGPFPTTPGAFQRTPGGMYDGFLLKLSAAGSIVYSTLLGGNSDDFGPNGDVKVDPAGNAYVAGGSLSTNFPTTPGAYRTTMTSAGEGVAVKMNASGTALIYGTYLGPISVRSHDLDSINRFVIVGDSSEFTPTIPTPTGWGGGIDAVVLKLNASGSALVFSRLLGGGADDSATAVGVAPGGNIVVAGATNSSDFPGWAFAGDFDVFIAELSNTGQAVLHSRTFGGSGFESPSAVTATMPEIVVFGDTSSPDLPAGAASAAGRYDPTYNGNYDGFIARFARNGFLLSSTYFGGNQFDSLNVGAVDGAGRLTIGGATSSTTFPIYRQLFGPTTENNPGFLSQLADVAPATVSPADHVIHVATAPFLQLTGNWQVVDDATAASGQRIHNPDAGLSRPAAPLANPSDYIEFTVRGLELGPYRMWVRGKAQNNSYSNDSVWVQFSYAADNFREEGGRQVYAIGSTEAMPIIIEDCTGCNVRGWGWQDNGYGQFVLGPELYFDDSRETRIRIQRREDGISIDQIVFSKGPSSPYVNYPPGYQHDDTTILSTPIGGNEDDIVLYAGVDNPQLQGAWRVVDDPTAAGGKRITHPDFGAPKISTPLASPTHYVELQFVARADVPYTIWVRGKAMRDDPYNDSVYMQFSGIGGYAIGSTEGLSINLETCSGAGLQGWGWRNGQWCGSGPLSTITFSADGPQTVRIQTREDGVSIDQVVLSTQQFAAAPPGSSKNDSTIVPR
jgi:hypothetical protein